MAVTSTPIVATDVVIKLDDDSGVLQDISGSSNKVEISPDNSVAEYRPYGTQWQQRKVIGKSVGLKLNVIYTTASDEALDILKTWYFGGSDVARTCQVYLPDDSAGSDLYAGEFVLASLGVPTDAEADDVVRVSAELQSHGAVTLTQVSS